VQVTFKRIINGFSLQSHNKIMTAKCSSKLTDLFSSGFPAYVIFFTGSVMVAVFTIFPREKNYRFDTKVWRYTGLIEG
jgi:hypothetical protein